MPSGGGGGGGAIDTRQQQTISDGQQADLRWRDGSERGEGASRGTDTSTYNIDKRHTARGQKRSGPAPTRDAVSGKLSTCLAHESIVRKNVSTMRTVQQLGREQIQYKDKANKRQNISSCESPSLTPIFELA